MTASDVSSWDAGLQYCSDQGYELVKWDTLDEYLDCSFIASSASKSRINVVFYWC